MADGDYMPDGVPFSELVRHDYSAVIFYCRSCHRWVSKTPADLVAIAPPETLLWTFTRKLRCVDCGQKDFTVRLAV